MTAQAGGTLSFKAQLRREMRARRAAIPPAERQRAAQRAARQLARLAAFRRARRIALYLDHRSELSTAPLIALCRRAGKAVYVPGVLRDDAMHWLRLDPAAALRKDRHGIARPASRAPRAPTRQLDLIVVPLIAFDAHGHRLGSGAGYYDRALAQHRAGRKPLRVGYAYAAQRAERLPADPWDVALDLIVTDSGLVVPSAQPS